jgi:two-component system CitB family sensor kinase
VKHYTEALRAQRHQFQNQLHVIAGLLSLGEVERAAEYLDRQIGRSQPWIDELREKVDDPVLVGLILSKGQLAQEAGVAFRLESGTRQYGSFGQKTDLVSIVVGNLLDNAIEAASASNGRKEVLVGLRTDGRGMWIRVWDTGPGIPIEVWDRMWERGVSSKGDHRGMGLPLILQVMDQFGGCIRVQTRTAQGNTLATSLFAGEVGREVLEEGVPPDFRPEDQWPEMPVGTVFTIFLAVR